MTVATALAAAAAGPIEIVPKEFTGSYLLSQNDLADVRQKNIAKGFGELDYRVVIPATGWWEFWAEGGGSPFDLIVDGKTLIHCPVASGVWEPRGKLQKMLNLKLAAGAHTLRLSRPEPWGIPWIGRMQFVPASALAGRVRVEPLVDCLALRRGASLTLRLTAGQGPAPETITVGVRPEGAAAAVWTQELQVPAGEGDFVATITLPTTAEGVFDASFADAAGRAVDRCIQYLVVDVQQAPLPAAEPGRELVQEIDCARQTPDYAPSETKVVASPLGAYRESGSKGRMGFNLNADWFAYTLKLPSLGQPYLIEYDYPDDDERVAIVSCVERCPNPYASTLGYASGGIYSLSGQMLTQQLYVYPREQDPRLLFQTWRTGLKAAAARIRVYRLEGLPLPLPGPRGPRSFGGYQEENIRFTSYYGATPDGDGWANFFKAAQNYGRHYRFLGGNLWQQTIGNYQATLWPCTTIKGYGTESEGGWCVNGPLSLKDPRKKDIVRLQLLVCEKYGLDYLGELHLPPNRAFQEHLDHVLGGDGDLGKNGPQKPWLTVSKTGECAVPSVSKPYWNVFYPGVQDWAASVVTEIAGRYHDSPAFKGVVVRLMSWVFSGWQTVPSIAWGYEDYTVALFEQETGIKVPVAATAPDRFAKRYEWLMANAYRQWVDWRCAKIYAYHCRLAKILTDARPDLKLYLSAYGPDYTASYTPADLMEKGWDGLIKESGIDLALYRRHPAIVVQGVQVYPSSSSRSKTPLDMALGRAAAWNAQQTRVTAQEGPGGSTSSIHLDADSFEGEMIEGRAIGYGENFKHSRNNTTIHGAGVIVPAGVHFLERFAEALAAGNMTVISDGSHGYDQQQPQYLRPFLAEYRALPAIGMTPVEPAGDPVAAWQGPGPDGKLYFYVVNRLSEPVAATLTFSAPAAPQRLTAPAAPAPAASALKLQLGPYELRSFANPPGPARLTAVACEPPPGQAQALAAQLAFAQQLASGNQAEPTLLELSPVALRQARAGLAAAQTALSQGRVVTARHLLLSADLVKLYEACHAYPPGLLHKKAPPAPAGALLPPALRDATVPAAAPTQVLDGRAFAPALAGVPVFRWPGAAIRLETQQAFANRYRLELACVAAAGFARPGVKLDGQELPAAGFAVETGNAWTRLTTRLPLALGPGAHRFELAKPQDADAALLYLRLEPVPRDLRACDWMIIGPFPGCPDPRVKGALAELMATPCPPELGRDFSTSCKGLSGRALRWQRPVGTADFVDLFELTGEYCNKVSYAVCRLESPGERDTQLRFGMDYWARLWLNGQEVFNNVGQHDQPPHKDEYAIPVRLAAGPNELLVKLHAGGQGNGFWLSVSDPGDLQVWQ